MTLNRESAIPTMNRNEQHGNDRLKILIVGAGIGGLTAAIALRQQGHEVSLFEQSHFSRESGAAIHLAPNSNGILRRLGIYAEDFGANPMRVLTEYTPESVVIKSFNLDEANKIWQHPWLMAHRVHLHTQLKDAATASTGEGIPAKLYKASRVINIDSLNANVTLQSGEIINGDIVIGADGVYSVARKTVVGDKFQPFGSGKSAFRFLISTKSVLDDPMTSKFAQIEGELKIWYSADRRIVVYPTTNNTLLNFACIHPSNETSSGSDSWSNRGSHEKMLEVFKGFDPAVLALLKKADAETLKIWELLDMDVLPTWVNERLALLGDAAHPFTPHQGQGAGCAIEDAASLAVVLPRDTPREETKERLALYQRIRRNRANRIQEFSRVAGLDLKSNVKFDMQENTNYNFGHDEWDNSTQELRNWKAARSPSIRLRLPIAFGPMPEPQQSLSGKLKVSNESTCTTASIKFKTSRTQLQNLFPNNTSYKFRSPGTVAYASFSQTIVNNVDGLGGSEYTHVGLYIHGVHFVKKNGDVVRGTYLPLLFKSPNNLSSAFAGEELGVPSVYSSVDTYRRDKLYTINTSWEGAMWGSFIWQGLEESDPSTENESIDDENNDDLLVHRYIPKVESAGNDQTGAVLVPHADQPQPKKTFKATKASFKIDPMDSKALPSLHNIISRLSELPVYGIIGGKIVEGLGAPEFGVAQRIE